MKKKILKVLALVACAVLLVVGSIAGTLAYMTSLTKTVTNTFTVGNVAITLDESKVTVYGELDGNSRVMANTYKLIPGHNYVKDPTIHVAEGSEDCWLFVKVENGISAIEDKTENGNTIANQMATNWTLIDEAKGIYAYKSKAVAGADVVVFNSFKIDGNADVSGYVTTTNTAAVVNVTAYAVQADGFDSAAKAWAAAETNWELPNNNGQ